jgi:hypothetical protein
MNGTDYLQWSLKDTLQQSVTETTQSGAIRIVILMRQELSDCYTVLATADCIVAHLTVLYLPQLTDCNVPTSADCNVPSPGDCPVPASDD